MPSCGKRPVAAQPELDTLQTALGYRFRDPALLQQAMIHRSAAIEHKGASNERLEFLGDAALGLIAARWLFDRHPDRGEGDLTVMRQSLVRRETLAGWAGRFALADLLTLSKGLAASGGRVSERILASAFEAVLGAVLVDADDGLAAVERLLEPLFAVADPEAALVGDPKGLLMQVVQSRFREQPAYQIVATSGPDHAPEVTVEVSTPGLGVLGRATARSKQQAEFAAARLAMAAVEQMPLPPPVEVRTEEEA